MFCLGGFCPGDFGKGGFCPGVFLRGFMSGGLCPGGFSLGGFCFCHFIVAWQADRLLWTIVINDHQANTTNSPAISGCF